MVTKWIYWLFVSMLILESHLALSKFEEPSSSVYTTQLSNQKDLGFAERIRASFRIRNRGRMKRRRNRFEGVKNKKRNFSVTKDFLPSFADSCCPAKYEMIEPIAGKNKSGHLVELFQDDYVQQRFYETSCENEVLNKPCRYLESRFAKRSKCIQQYSFTYALIRNTQNTHFEFYPWALDYISIRSGCACQIVPSRKKKKISEYFEYD